MSESGSDDEQPRLSKRSNIVGKHSREVPAEYKSNPTEVSQGGHNKKEADMMSAHMDTILNKGTKRTKSFFSSASIYKVPKNLQELNDRAYTPRLISIGPFHIYTGYTTEVYKDVKKDYANNLFLRLTEGRVDQEKSNKKTEVIQECMIEMMKSRDDARKSYAGDRYDHLDAEMMVIDGCFILELLYRYYDLMKEEGKNPVNGGDGNSKALGSSQQPHEGEETSTSRGRKKEMIDPIFDSISVENMIKHDLLLLENQIPFFVLEKLFKLTVEKIPNCPHKRSLTDYVLFYFSDLLNPEGYSPTSCSPNDCVLRVSDEGEDTAGKAKHYYHILHLLHENYLPRETSKKEESGQNPKQKTKFSEFTLSASNLEYAGVKFKPLLGNSPFDVEFDEDKGLSWWCRRASFSIPTVSIHEATEPLLRNLIAFEQCVPGVSQHFTSYAFLMDMLVNSEKDVQVLKDAKVMYNYLGSDEDASKLFNKLCKEVCIEDFYFKDSCRRAFEYSEYGWPKILGYLKQTYFSSPWAFIGFCLAFIAFGMTVTQFVYGFFNKGS